MTSTDPFEYDDAAYLLGALSPENRAAFEAHLLTCAECNVRIAEIEDVPALFADISEDEVRAAFEPIPDTLLPGLLRRAAAQRRRQRWLVAGLASVAAACLIALVVAVWPSNSTTSNSGKQPAAVAQPFAAVAHSPVRATATLTDKAWGTAIDVRCRYVAGAVERSFSYDLVVVGRDNSQQTIGSWTLPPDRNISFPAGTSLTRAQIAKIEIRTPSGKTILRLTA